MKNASPLWRLLLLTAGLLLGATGSLWAQDAAAAPAAPDSGDTAWMLMSTVLVLLMTLPGLALFYGGLVRSKNVLSVLVQCFAIAALMSVIWVVYGYSFATAGEGTYFGNASRLFLKGLEDASLVGTIPESVFITFQMTFIIITPALIVGAFAERMKFSAILIFTTVWVTFSYLPIWHMAWAVNIGLFSKWGVLDFAGGTVVHINAGIAGLVACIMVGKRRGYGATAMHPHNVPFTLIGAALLWVGWFGFNAGSAVAANGSAGFAMLTTQIATAAAVLAWMLVEWLVTKKATAVGAATGAVAGLVAITPASGTSTVAGALIIGAVSAVICYFCATSLKRKLQYDDSLDVFGVHGIGGIVGAVLTGVFVRGGAADGQLMKQILSVLVTIGWSGVVSVIALLIAKYTVGLRVTEQAETEGLDTTSHGETAYTG
ncbi:MAG: ammonium transporter [Verrucomicrobiales bacterium]|nr:ammonium transporter [Verrucomicrobiales bacterium]